MSHKHVLPSALLSIVIVNRPH
ncbi:rCG36337, partial [Rattus norvegicus]